MSLFLERITPKFIRQRLNPSVLFVNISANFVGRLWSVLIGLVFVPIYIRYLGIESYGLIGIFTTLQAVLSLLDLGLSTTLNRELARLSVMIGTASQMRNLARTLEITYWLFAILLGSIAGLLSPVIAQYWVQPNTLLRDSIQQAFIILSFSFAVQWPLSLYSGGLLGLQRQAVVNILNVSIATARALGSWGVLVFISPTLSAFLIWQATIGAVHTLGMAWLFWRELPFYITVPRFDQAELKRVGHFAASMSGIAIVTLILTHLDKVILSRLLSLEQFGYYVLAGTVTSAIHLIVNPFFTAIFPRFSTLVVSKDHFILRSLYHRSCRMLSIVLFPIALVLILFSPEIMLLWTHNSYTVEQTWPLVSLLVAGTALNGIMNIPYALTLAYGWTKFALYQNIIAILILLPALLWATTAYGAKGAASIWVVLNASYVFISMYFIHSRLLKGELRRWYIQDIFLVLLPLLVGFGFLRWLSL